MSKRITASLSEMRVAAHMAKNGIPISEHHANMLLSAQHHIDPANWYENEPPDKTVRKIFLSGPTWRDRPAAIKHIQRKDNYIASAGLLNMVTLNDDYVYRIGVFPDGVDVLCFGLESVDSKLEGHYDGPDALPKWVQERLALLNMIPSTPPTSTVEGIGRRISAHVYWVFAPDASTSA